MRNETFYWDGLIVNGMKLNQEGPTPLPAQYRDLGANIVILSVSLTALRPLKVLLLW